MVIHDGLVKSWRTILHTACCVLAIELYYILYAIPILLYFYQIINLLI